MNTILAPVDFSAVSDRVCETAAALAKAQSGRVVLLHCVRPSVIPGDHDVQLEWRVRADEQASDRLSLLKEKIADAQLSVETLQLVGPPAATILDQAEKLRATCLVLGSHDHGVFCELLAGSTTHSVLLKAACPVVVIHEGAKQEEPV